MVIFVVLDNSPEPRVTQSYLATYKDPRRGLLSSEAEDKERGVGYVWNWGSLVPYSLFHAVVQLASRGIKSHLLIFGHMGVAHPRKLDNFM